MNTMKANRIVTCMVLILLLLPLVWVGAAESAESERMVVAVSPFENGGPEESSDYIGFQVREFLSSALGSFEGISVVERGRLQDIIKEQKLQLSGMTDSSTTAEIGKILNASHLLTGSFSLNRGHLNLNARIVEVETGEAVASSIVEADEAESYTPLYQALLFDLIAKLPQYEVTIPVQATLETIDQQAKKASENYSKALEALFENDDEKALSYLQETIGGSGIDFVRYGEMASEYSRVLSRVEGSSFYAKMIEQQIARNKELTEQTEPLSLYRSTLKVLTDRIRDLLTAEHIEVSAFVPPQSSWNMGSVSMRVTLPEKISMKLKEETVAAITQTFSGQDIVELTSDGLHQKAPPEGELLSRMALEQLMRTRWEGRIGYAVEFLGRDESVLFRLLGEPVSFTELEPESRRFSASAETILRVDEQRDGWQLVEGNAVTVQTRNLRDFASVRVVLRPETLEIEGGFRLYSDEYWQSLLAHAYRKKSVKISTDENDPAPSIKELMVTDALFHTGDEELDPVPLLPRDGSIAAFVRPYGIAYYGDRRSTSVAAEWSSGAQRDLISRSESLSGQFDGESVLIFPMPPYRGKSVHFTRSLTFTVRTDGSEKSVTVNPDLGLEWDVEPKDNGYTRFFDIATRGDRVYYTALNRGETIAVDVSTGEELWRLGNYGARDFLGREEGPIICSYRSYFARPGGKTMTALDPDSGEKLWEKKLSLGAPLSAPGSELLIFNFGDSLIGLEAETGVELWRSPFPYNTGLSLDAEQSVFCRGKLYFVLDIGGRAHDLLTVNPQSGKMNIIRQNVYSCSSDGDLLYFAESSKRERSSSSAEFSLHAADPADISDGEFLWSSDEARKYQTIFMGEKLLYSVDEVSHSLTALDKESVKRLWSREIGPKTTATYRGGNIHLSDGRVLDATTGELRWRWFNREEMGRLLYSKDGTVYAGSGEKYDTKVIP